MFAVVLAAMAFSAVAAVAQEDRPEITPGERRVPRKKDAEPRALAVLQLSPDGKTSLLPIAILINGKFWDASAYKAAPVPMALDPGTVYEAERSGSSQGLFTVSAALQSKAANAPVPWLATGSWVPTGSDTGKKTLQAEPVPVGMDNSDAPPRLTKNPAPATSTAPAPKPSENTGKTSTPSSSTPTPSSGDEPPRLSKPPAQQSPPSSSTPAPDSTQPQSETKPGDSKPDHDKSGNDKPDTTKSDTTKPDATKSDTAKSADRPKGPESDSGASESNRPRLRRGKPAASFADEDIPGYSKVGANMDHASPSPAPAKAASTAAAGPVQLIPAISDSAGPDPHSYGFEWLKGDEADRRQQLIALAQDQVRAYVDARAKARIELASAPKPTSRHTPAKKPARPVLSNVQMTAYDLWSTNQPIVIFSAQAQIPPVSADKAAAETSSGANDNLQYSVLLVAYPDIYNNMHKLYVGVTDKYHLDLTPRLELIDAVDADGDGRGELLFRETSDVGTGWILYRVTADKLWKMYDSLNPE